MNVITNTESDSLWRRRRTNTVNCFISAPCHRVFNAPPTRSAPAWHMYYIYRFWSLMTLQTMCYFSTFYSDGIHFTPFIWRPSLWYVKSRKQVYCCTMVATKGDRPSSLSRAQPKNLLTKPLEHLCYIYTLRIRGVTLFMRPRSIKALWLDQEEGSGTTYHTSLLTQVKPS